MTLRLRTLPLFLIFGIATAAYGAGPPIPTESCTADHSHCTREMTAPIDIDLTYDAGSLGPGVSFDLRGNLVLLQDAPHLRLRFTAEGGATVTTATQDLGVRTAGEELPFGAFVSYQPGAEESVVHVWAEILAAPQGRLLSAERVSLYTVMRDGRTFAGEGGFHHLRIQAVAAAEQSGTLDRELARQARQALVRIPATIDERPFEYRAPTFDEQGLNEAIGAPRMGHRPVAAKDDVNFTVQGQVLWTDENGLTHPVWGATVEIRDDELIGTDLVADGVTDLNGNYAFNLVHDDGFGAGNPDIFVRVRTANGWIDLTDGGSTYESDSGITEVNPGDVLNRNFTFGNGGNGDAWSVFQSATWIAGYVANVVEASAFAQVEVVWPNGGSGSFYDGKVQIEQDDRYDWDTIHHEYGHYAMDVLNIENNPGGPHNIGDCTANVRGTKSEGNDLAWGEGWPTYFGTSAQVWMNNFFTDVPRVGDVSYQDVEDGSVIYSLETQDNNGRGEDNEVTVQRMLWDLFDANNDGRDTISLSDTSIWDDIKAAAGSPHILSTYWAGLRNGVSNSTDLAMGGIASDHLVGPRLASPAGGAIVSPSNRSFSWNPDVGCPASYSGDDFDLVFYDANTLNKILTKPGLNSPSHMLSLADLSALIAVTHDVLWAVEGRHLGTNPQTGPYLGESFAITVNTPPVCDAGGDYTVECDGATTSVALDGTGSSDADGDALTYAWSTDCPGGSFDDDSSATPTLTIDTSDGCENTCTVTLEVSDGIQSATCDAQVDVVDTTDPVLTCATDIELECNSPGGVLASDPQIQAFLASATATDVCDPNPVVTNDVPADFLFPVKQTTTVTFTATDKTGNSVQCTADVTVVDNTAPEFEISVDPSALWPPNHKMVDITVTVDELSDVCDPDPVVTLVSITSDEAPNDNGDGNTEPDIMGAMTGTDDREFQLRAERDGRQDGRVYTIVYEASDICGNTTERSVTVTVGHDQGGMAKASDGFGGLGLDFERDAKTFTLILETLPGAETPAEPVTADGGALDLAEAPRTGVAFDASQVDLRHAYIGNTAGWVRPVDFWLSDQNGDGHRDLVLEFPVPETLEIERRMDALDGPLGLHYESPRDGSFLVEDIFALGSPVDAKRPETKGHAADVAEEEQDQVSETAKGDPVLAGEPDVIQDAAPTRNGILGIHPNPFNPSTTVSFGLVDTRNVRIRVHNLQGEVVRTLVDQTFLAGRHDVTWDGQDNGGRGVASGVYFFVMQGGDTLDTRKAVLIK